MRGVLVIKRDPVSFARFLRRSQTDAEKLLWSKLRSRQMCGVKFRRQQPIGSYIVDFVCYEAFLIVELDGGQHATVLQQRKDEERTRLLEREGYHVLRFWDNEALNHIDNVIEKIALTLTLSQRAREK